LLKITLPETRFFNRILLKWEAAYASEYCVTVTESITPTLEPITCRYQADSDEDTIVQLIQAESEAVNNEAISIIQAIFAEDAIIRDGASGEEWNDPITRYTTFFANVDFTNAIHFEIQPTGAGITANAAWFTSGSSGEYVTKDGFSGSYNNPPSSDHWTFGKNSSGCWVITEFTFNASHIPFPP